jgi:protein SCO1/2
MSVKSEILEKTKTPKETRIKQSHIILIAISILIVLSVGILGPIILDSFTPKSDPIIEEEPLKNLGQVPSFTLINQDGQNVSLSDLSGKCILMDFIYTRCPMANMCPKSSSNFAQVQSQVERELSDKYVDKVSLITLSFDSTYDTPEKLKQYGERYGANFSIWQFLSGDNESTRQVMDGFGVYYNETSSGKFDHTMMAVLIDQESNVRNRYYGNIYEIESVMDDIQQLVD